MKLLTNLALLAVGLLLPTFADPVYDLNFLSSQGTPSVLYSGDQSNWLSPACGTSAGYGGYNYCGGDLIGDLLTGTRAGVTSPSVPFATSLGYQADILNAQSQIIAIVAMGPSDGCTGSLGTTVTCGLSMELVTSQNGGVLSSSLVSAFSSIPIAGSFTATGANQTAFVVDWSDGRVDDINVQIAGAQATPEPATIGLVGAALIPLCLFRRGKRK